MARILITGAAGGFGVLTVEALVNKGHSVVGSVRDINGRNKASAERLRSLGAKVVDMDVTQDQSVADGVAKALDLVSEIDVVINNAGVGVLGVQESFTPQDWMRIFDVNVFGVQRVNRAILPHMRQRGAGLLIHISSLLGRITIPFYGPYNASKWALEALAENYRAELSGFGVDVAIVEPGGYPTSFIDHLVRPSDRSRDASLGTLPNEAQTFLHGFEQALAANPAQDPKNVARAIVELIETPAGQRPFRTIVDKMGMGDAIQPYNDQLMMVTKGLYSAFHIDHFLTLKT